MEILQNIAEAVLFPGIGFLEGTVTDSSDAGADENKCESDSADHLPP